MNVVVLTIEGVLTASDDLRNAQPTTWAHRFYEAWRSQFNVILLTNTDRELAERWLKRESILKWSTLLTMPSTSPFSYPRWRAQEVRDFVAEGFEVAYMIDTNPEVLQDVEALGIPTIRVSYADKPPGWRETTTAPRSWSMVVDTVEESQGA